MRTRIRAGMGAASGAALALSMLLAPPSAASPPALYHSPGDDGLSGGLPALVAADVPITLHLYLGVGTTPSTALPCQAGDGDELCGYQLRLQGSGVDLQSFAPADPDILFNLTPGQLDLIGGDYQQGDLGPSKLGDLVLQGPTGTTLDLTAGDFVTASLAKQTLATPTTIVQLPEPGAASALAFGYALLVALGRGGCRARRRAPAENPETDVPC